MDITIENIKKLKEGLLDYSDEAQKEILDWEKQYKRAALVSRLSENDAVKMIIERANRNIEQINTVLLNDEDLTTEDRKVLMRDRKRWQWFLGLFESAHQTAAEVGKKINDELNSNGERD